MSFLQWMALAGALLLVMALASAQLRRLPISTAAIYLALGVAISPIGFGWLHVDVRESTIWLERLTEVAVILSLFVGGLKLRLPLDHASWRAAYRLAGPVMLASIGAVAWLTHVLFGFDLASALLVGAILAPTDPVLASAVSVNDARDHDRMRYGLSGEAGLNDGMAFPFVVFALEWSRHDGPGAWVGTWALHRLLWAVPAALVLGFAIGRQLGRFAITLRSRHPDRSAPSDFLALAMIALTYVGAEAIGCWGFLAVFAAGVGLRRAEAAVVRERPHPDVKGDEHPPAEHIVSATVDEQALEEPAVAAGVLVGQAVNFGDTAERILEILIVVLVGVALPLHYSAAAIPLALALFLLVRPLATFVLLTGTRTTLHQRALLGWFGVRGIGSLYYLTYTFRNGFSGPTASVVADVVITVVALSILLHGISAHPILANYQSALDKNKARRSLRPLLQKKSHASP